MAHGERSRCRRRRRRRRFVPRWKALDNAVFELAQQRLNELWGRAPRIDCVLLKEVRYVPD